MSEKTQFPNQQVSTKPAEGWDFFTQRVEQKLHSIEQKNRTRRLRPITSNSQFIDLTNNDYLALRQDHKLRSQILDELSALPFGSGGSRLLGGEWPVFRELELEFARLVGFEDCLFFPSGYAANEAICQALFHPQGSIFSDSLNHASILDGIRMSRFPLDKQFVFKHNCLEDLESKLKDSNSKFNVVITESLFSMDGDFAPLKALDDLCKKYRGILVVDEAHTIGVYGPLGAGYLCQENINLENVIGIYPCGKALGSQGAIIAGPKWLRELLINTARSFIFTTAASPWIATALLHVLHNLPRFAEQRSTLHRYSQIFRDHLLQQGWDIGSACSHIFPIIVGSDREALKLESELLDQGIITRAIRPPTVPPKMCRLRLSLNSGLSPLEFKKLLETFTIANS